MPPEASDMTNFAQILVPVDYSECSDAALRYAADVASAFSGRLLALHVLPIRISGLFGDFPTPAADAMQISAERDRLRAHVRSVLAKRNAAPPYDVDVFWGAPALDIVPYAVERGADAIVLGTHGRTGFKHVLLGSVAERIVRTAPCPVITVHAGADGAEGRPSGERQDAHRPQVRPRQALLTMARRPATVAPDALLSAARDVMAAHAVRHIPVVEGQRLVGILSDRDLAAHTGHLEHTRVDAVMTPNPVTIAADVDVNVAAELMVEHKVRALPVVDGERVIGIVSTDDILEDYVRAARR
jgi:CBS domain-containing protein/nucleotide-binding universal stress UspA family protein